MRQSFKLPHAVNQLSAIEVRVGHSSRMRLGRMVESYARKPGTVKLKSTLESTEAAVLGLRSHKIGLLPILYSSDHCGGMSTK